MDSYRGKEPPEQNGGEKRKRLASTEHCLFKKGMLRYCGRIPFPIPIYDYMNMPAIDALSSEASIPAA
ncbi:MAG: hypothetical protein ACI33O_08305, partial [Bhargavaea sp.]